MVMTMPHLKNETEQTIADFGDQWTTFTENDGFYASQEMLQDIFGPLMQVDELRDQKCAEIGAGSGRISQMLLRAGAAHVIAVEPSRASEVLAANLEVYGDRVTVQREAGDSFRADNLDFICSIGVLHHIPDPTSTVGRMHAALRDGGKAVVWLYGREGNALYLAIFEPLRWITRRLPVWANAVLAWGLYPPLALYIALCRLLPLPMKSYMREVLHPIGGKAIRLVIVDQLNPRWAKYYSRTEAIRLLEAAGFANVKAYHRHGYSWTVSGEKR